MQPLQRHEGRTHSGPEQLPQVHSEVGAQCRLVIGVDATRDARALHVGPPRSMVVLDGDPVASAPKGCTRRPQPLQHTLDRPRPSNRLQPCMPARWGNPTPDLQRPKAGLAEEQATATANAAVTASGAPAAHAGPKVTERSCSVQRASRGMQRGRAAPSGGGRLPRLNGSDDEASRRPTHRRPLPPMQSTRTRRSWRCCTTHGCDHAQPDGVLHGDGFATSRTQCELRSDNDGRAAQGKRKRSPAST